MSTTNRLDLLLKEITDEYVRENFIKLKRYLDCVEAESGGSTTIIGGGSGTTSPWTTGERSLSSVSTTVLDSIPLSSFVCAYYHLCFKEQGGVETKTLKIDVKKVDTDVEDQLYAKKGNPINIEVNAVTVGTNMELQIVNNEAFGIDASFAKLTL